MLFSKPPTRQPDAKQVLGQLAGQKKAASNPERRLEGRTDFSIGIVVVPLHDDSPDISKAFSAITKDISTTGIGVIANHSILTPEVVICLSGKSERRLLRALVRYRKELGLGWVRFGMEVTDVLDKNEYPQLSRFVGSIMP
jgi:hypothetical protein